MNHSSARIIPFPTDRVAQEHSLELRPVRMGIVGCSGIVPRAVLEPAVHVDGLEIHGVANRTYAKAQMMGEQYGIPVIYPTLEELLADPLVDAVYIGLGNALHAEWIMRSLEAGKHVLVEKPLCLEAGQLPQLEQAAKERGLLLAEAMMVAHHPWQEAIRGLVSSGEYGKLLRTSTRITIPARNDHLDNYRSRAEEGGGCWWDLGCYWLQFVQQISGEQSLSRFAIKGASEFNGPNGCDWTFEAEAVADDGLIASATLSFEQPYACRHVLHFERAIITIPDVFRCNLGFYKMKLKITLLKDGQEIGEAHQHIFEPMNYYVNQLRAFTEQVRQQHRLSNEYAVIDHGLEQAMERIRVLDQVYRDARSGLLQH
ncbi:Gfo/Idh/MocA family oxidoreductase [Paenibacillus hunanensis]|uniref:Gfo/Idh/MocA family protein n=1 Tax=Paenibacillus hunanensis TaxID=539262 RepID=UPI002A6AA698|nr:Gfo/Idh/MocA family oxidoreductase [Paenibacillus hunanensis]WPP40164.1 Gfo/Idh/MocA family oxidoreductase [Paenibacillus hunanensis]